jgi:hypothetical protein
MSKVSIGLRGWRFDEEEVFDEEGDFRSLAEMSPDTRDRIGRLMEVVDKPCDACWLIEEEEQHCRSASVVYGEPLREVVLCDQHELDFLYWFREEDGRALAGEEEFPNAFRQWISGGGRAPDGYAGLEHVDTDPETIPEPEPEQSVEEEIASLSDEERESLDIDLDDLDI